MGLRDQLEQSRKRKAAAAAPKPPPPKPAPPAKPADDAVATYSCGHTKPVQNLQKRLCPECTHNETEKILKARKPKKTKFKEKVVRLPDGSRFTKTYDATAVQWAVVLEVPGAPPFTAQGSASFRVEFDAFEQYQRWATQQTWKEDSRQEAAAVGSTDPKLDAQESDHAPVG